MPRIPAVRALGLVTCIAVLGCGAPDDPGEGSAFVLFDAAARAGGLAIVDGAEVLPATALPIELDAPGRVALSHLPGSRPHRSTDRVPPASQLVRLKVFDLEPGEAVHVRGSDGDLLRGAADPDQIVVLGPEAAATELASLFGARPSREPGDDSPSALGHPERWAIRVPDVLSLAALLEERQLEGVAAIVPVFSNGDAADEQRAELERLRDDHDAAAAERDAIVRDLAVIVARQGPPVIELGRGIPLSATLVNTSPRPRAVVRPGDGSSVGWREPFVRWTAEREVQPGVWQQVAERRYARCGNYDADWHKDAMLLGPGQSIPFEWGTPPEAVLELGAAGNYRFYAHYEYRRGLLGRGPFGITDAREGVSDGARLLEGVPGYEIVSAPVEIRIEPGLELSVRPLRTPLQLDADARPSDLFEVSLINRSAEAKRLPLTGPERIHLQVLEERGPWSRMWIEVTPRWPAELVLEPGGSVRLQVEGEPLGVHKANDGDRTTRVHLRATGWLSDRAHSSLELRSPVVAVELAPPR